MLNADIMILSAAAAKRHGLPPPLVYAIIETESGGNPWAIRYEPAFYEKYIAPAPIKGRGTCSAQTEARMQATSWGLMQLMGATARETGFDGVFLSQLCDPKVGIEWGCTYLANLVQRYASRYRWEGVVAAYNAGSPKKTKTGLWVNQSYVDKIRAARGFQFETA